MFEKSGSWVHEMDVVFWFGSLDISVRDRRGAFLESKVREVICGRNPDDSTTDDYGVCRSRRHRLGFGTAASPTIVTDWHNHRLPPERRTMIEIKWGPQWDPSRLDVLYLERPSPDFFGSTR